MQTGAHIGQEERRTCMAAIEVRHLYKRFEQKGVTVEALSTESSECQEQEKVHWYDA